MKKRRNFSFGSMYGFGESINFINKQLGHKSPKKTFFTEWDFSPKSTLIRLADPFGNKDKDKHLNLFDCRPFDKRRHGVKPNRLMQERINKLPIFITTSAISTNKTKTPKKYYHIAERDAPKKAKQKVLSVLKRYPQIVSQIEKRKPEFVSYSDKGISEKGKKSKVMGFSDRGGAAVRTKDIDKDRLSGTREVAKTTVHELKHVSQTKHLNKEKLKLLFKGRYESKKGEINARKEEERLYYSRPDINIKIAKRELEKNKQKKSVKIQDSEGQKRRLSKEEIREAIQKRERYDSENASTGFRKMFGKEEQ